MAQQMPTFGASQGARDRPRGLHANREAPERFRYPSRMTCHPPDTPCAFERTLMTCRVALTGLTLLCFAAGVSAGKAHQHGAVTLDVAVEAAEVSLSVEMPLDSLVGFERAPRTQAERQAAAAALAKMRDGGALFRFDAAAQCTLASAKVEAPVLEPAAQTTTQTTTHPTAKPAAAGEHADLDASYAFRCAQPVRLASLEVLLFDAFPRVERIDVQAVLPHGQRKVVLRRAARTVRLAK
jgi:hypothetical protein